MDSRVLVAKEVVVVKVPAVLAMAAVGKTVVAVTVGRAAKAAAEVRMVESAVA